MTLTSHPSAPEGAVLRPSTYSAALFQPPCAILCRTTAPLVAHAYALLQRDIPCRVLGRDIGAQLSELVKKMRATNLEDLRARLAAWHRRESDRAHAENRDPSRIDDQHACLLFFIDGLDEDSQTVASVLAKIDLMFGEATAIDFSRTVVLSTIHKAKGLEWPTVCILDFHLMPSRYARTPAALQQEKNLIYVAQTRAQQRLVYIQSDKWQQNA